MPTPPPLRWNSWCCGLEYTSREVHDPIHHTRAAINCDALEDYVSSLRGNHPRIIQRYYSVGTQNFVQKVRFCGGEAEWVMRLRMFPFPDDNAGREKILYHMRSEIATMEFVA